MSKFSTMIFTGGTEEVFVAHAKKFNREQAIEAFRNETGIKDKAVEDISEAYCKYYVSVPDWCGFEGDGGCYTFCSKDDRGSFPVYVISLRNREDIT